MGWLSYVLCVIAYIKYVNGFIYNLTRSRLNVLVYILVYIYI